MGFWIFMLLMNMIIPAIMVACGKLFSEKAPEKINGIYGYRTPMSMKNRDTWEFAHKHFGQQWLSYGIKLSVFTMVIMLFLLGKDASRIGGYGGVINGIQVALMLLPIFSTERALRKTFDKQGNRK